MRRFFLTRENIDSGRPTLTGPDARHIRAVLRLKPGDEVLLFDGEGWDYRARIDTVTQKTVTFSVLERFPSVSESPAEITIAQALLKGKKMDRIVRQVTELGIYALIPVIAQRSVPRPGKDGWTRKKHRWEAIAKESLKQCGRSQALRLQPPAAFESLIESSRNCGLTVIFHHDHASSPNESELCRRGDVSRVLALVGPEGGFTAEEVASAVASGFACVSFGPRTLKADTAVVAACAVLQHAFGDMAGRLKKA